MQVLRFSLVAVFLCWTYAAVGDEPVPAKDSTIRLKFEGSYEISVGGVGVARGEGTTTIDLDKAFLDRINREVRDTKPMVEDVLKTFLSLPSTIASASETLQMLSDPETQKALRQVESLLRLVPRTPPPVKSVDQQ